MNRLRIIMIILYCLPMLAVGAQGEEQARRILRQATEAYRKAGGVKITFRTYGTEDEETGTIYLKDDKFVLETTGVRTWFDGHTQWTYLEENEEVNILEPTSEEMQMLNPYVWLSCYEQGGYRLKMGNRKAGVESVVLSATTPKQEIQYIFLDTNPKSHHPMTVSFILRGNRHTTTIVIDTYEEGRHYPDSFFTFDKKQYPDAEVVDLRL